MLPFLIPALITGGASLISGLIQGASQKSSADAQSSAAQAGIDEQRRQFDAVQKLLNPYVQAGTQSLDAQKDLIGMNGSEAQQKAVDAIGNSSEMQALVKQGETGILQNAAATGGLRGGNTQGALAQFRPQMLSNLINQQYQRLGGLSSMGQASAAGVGAAGQGAANQISSLLTQQGNAQAAGIMGQGGMLNAIPNALTSGLGTFMGLGGTF